MTDSPMGLGSQLDTLPVLENRVRCAAPPQALAHRSLLCTGRNITSYRLHFICCGCERVGLFAHPAPRVLRRHFLSTARYMEASSAIIVGHS
jgi:hypothetical protein